MSGFDEQPDECPLCMELLEIDDINFFPCSCGYQICQFCWHRIRMDENGLCPACRKPYSEDPAEFKPLSDNDLQRLKKERRSKEGQRKQKATESRKHLANVRVMQKNLVFVVGLPPRLADAEELKRHEYFGKFGKIVKVVINQNHTYAGYQGPCASAYVTYQRTEDALRAKEAVNNIQIDGRKLKASLGTTKYCSHFLRGTQCTKTDCMYLHELGDESASFTKEDMQQGKHQEYQQLLNETYLNSVNTSTARNKTTSPVLMVASQGSSNSSSNSGTPPQTSGSWPPTGVATPPTSVDPLLAPVVTGKVERAATNGNAASHKNGYLKSLAQSNGSLPVASKVAAGGAMSGRNGVSSAQGGKTQGATREDKFGSKVNASGGNAMATCNGKMATGSKQRSKTPALDNANSSTQATGGGNQSRHKRQQQPATPAKQQQHQRCTAQNQNVEKHRDVEGTAALSASLPRSHSEHALGTATGRLDQKDMDTASAQGETLRHQNSAGQLWPCINGADGTLAAETEHLPLRKHSSLKMPYKHLSLVGFADDLHSGSYDISPTAKSLDCDNESSTGANANANDQMLAVASESEGADWQTAFGFTSKEKIGTKKPQYDDELGFDPIDVSSQALADLIEKEKEKSTAVDYRNHFASSSGAPLPHAPLQHHQLHYFQHQQYQELEALRQFQSMLSRQHQTLSQHRLAANSKVDNLPPGFPSGNQLNDYANGLLGGASAGMASASPPPPAVTVYLAVGFTHFLLIAMMPY